MKTTTRNLFGGLACGAMLYAVAVLWTGSTLAQAPAKPELNPAADSPDEDTTDIRRLKALDLCKRARQAMEAGNWETADSLISRAEAFKVRWPVMYFGDKPEKVRKDYERIRGRASSNLPSQQFKPSNKTGASDEPPVSNKKGNASASLDPFAAQEDLSAPAATQPTLNDPRAGAKHALAKGRAELAQGNLAGARYWYEKANQAALTWNNTEDSPEKLLVEIQAASGPAKPAAAATAAAPTGLAATNPVPGANPVTAPAGANPTTAAAPLNPFAKPTTLAPPTEEDQLPAALRRPGSGPNAPATAQATPPALSAGPATAPNTQPQPATPAAAAPLAANAPTAAMAADEASRRAQSDGLLWTARRALAVGDIRRATESVNQAKALAVTYDPREDSPARVETAISRFADLMQRPSSERDSEGYRRRYAELQMTQAEDLLRMRDFDEAERLANEAKRRGVPYSPFENNPDDLLKRIAEARRAANATTAQIERLPPRSQAQAGAQPAPAPAPAPTAPKPDPAGTAQAELKLRTLDLLKQARTALQAGDVNTAERLAAEAERLRVPEEAFGPRDDRPWLVMLQVQKARQTHPAAAAQANNAVQPAAAIPAADTPPTAAQVQPAAAVMPIANTTGEGTNTAQQAYYDPQRDASRNIPASSQQPAAPQPTGPSSSQKVGVALFLQGEEALRQHDPKTASALFREAAAHHGDLDPAMQQRLQDRLQLASQAEPVQPREGKSIVAEAAQAQALKVRQASDELNRRITQSKRLQETDPKQAAVVLQQARAEVERSSLDSANRDILLRRVDRSIDELTKYVDVNRARIELDDRNRAVENEIDQKQNRKVEVQENVAKLVNEFNDLMDQRRFAEAELVAKKAYEIAPNEPVVGQIMKYSKFVRASNNAQEIRELSQDGVLAAFASAERAAIPYDDSIPMVFPEAKTWKQLTETRTARLARESHKRTEREIEIEQRLKTPVSMQFKEAPLQEVMRHLSNVTGVNIYLDPRGLAEEAVDSSTPITINLNVDITLKSALHLILEPLHLSYVIKDEVLKITSEQMRNGEVYTHTYNVADLVIPIPNFVPTGQMGLAGALADAQRNAGAGGPVGGGSSQGPLALVASNSSSSANGNLDPNVMAQFGGVGGIGGLLGGRGGATGIPQNIPFASPGGLGGGSQPDFDSLIELITQTVAPQSWTEVGGAGAIKEFPTNLSLVISQTQEVHEQIAELLEQLRRLQDLQVTVEVRFINIDDSFWERMGINFDVNIPTDIPSNVQQSVFPNGPAGGKSMSLGTRNSITTGIYNTTDPTTLQAPTQYNFSQDLEIPFSQTSFNTTAPNLPQIGSALTSAVPGGATLGFAILSDLETYFFLQAVQTDIRNNVMQSPKVTLFNGQQAFVSDTQQVPFVITVIPVVGDFAAAQQPVIVVLSQGTFLTVQAVVSSDRRFIRLTVVPFFSNIENVNTFTFNGSSSTTRDTSTTGPVGASTSQNNIADSSVSGTTVQLPTFAFTTVTTTVSVPDGGTVLLGGIKRLAEQRLEAGVPILNKLPYVNRLFNNIGTARWTQSLMMMVTPRIIIQEEEEARIGVPPGP